MQKASAADGDGNPVAELFRILRSGQACYFARFVPQRGAGSADYSVSLRPDGAGASFALGKPSRRASSKEQRLVGATPALTARPRLAARLYYPPRV